MAWKWVHLGRSMGDDYNVCENKVLEDLEDGLGGPAVGPWTPASRLAKVKLEALKGASLPIAMSTEYCIDYYPRVCAAYTRVIQTYLSTMMSSDAPRTPFTLLTANHFTRLAPLTVRVHRDDTLYSAVADVPEILHRVTLKRVSDLDERQKSQYDLVRCYMIIYENDVERDCIRMKKEHKYQEALRKKAEEDRMEGKAVSANTKATTERSRLGKSSEACQRPVPSDALNGTKNHYETPSPWNPEGKHWEAWGIRREPQGMCRDTLGDCGET
ncbi:hypothetical protein NMY22_g15591 [Coprinellus aureogranulatus]|nr:hypothetical protein NMY22_g15591 [Coprinellus aureogranulatus]